MPAPRLRPAGAPDPPDLAAALERVEPSTFARYRRWDDVEVVGADLALIEAAEPRLTGVRLRGGDVGEARLVHLSISDGELVGVSAANVIAEGAVLRRVAADQLKLTGANLTLAELHDVRLTDGRADFASLNRARLRDVLFTGCRLRDVDFGGAQLERVRFEGCDLTAADFSGAQLKQCTIAGCTLDGLKGAASLTGVAMPWVDIVAAAGVFASALGITLLPDDAPGPAV